MLRVVLAELEERLELVGRLERLAQLTTGLTETPATPVIMERQERLALRVTLVIPEAAVIQEPLVMAGREETEDPLDSVVEAVVKTHETHETAATLAVTQIILAMAVLMEIHNPLPRMLLTENLGAEEVLEILDLEEMLVAAEARGVLEATERAQTPVVQEVLAQMAIQGMLVLTGMQIPVVQGAQETQAVLEILVPLELRITLI